MMTLNVELGDRSYPIYIGTDLLNQADLLTQHIAGNSALIVTNETVAPLYLQQVRQHLGAIRHEVVILPDGERFKNLEVLNLIYDALLKNQFDRDTTLIALGGGVIGDITGFAAATYQRGVNLIQIPTTLLSQVDSSVGGKTAVNHPAGKNMIGAFYQPKAVIADTNTLNTLEDRQLSSGIAEVIKYGLIRDTEFHNWLKEHMKALLHRDPAALAYAIERSCKNKADVVSADEKEKGQRALLNLGHTFGHAIETGMGYGEWLHGEAVATGMMMAAILSCKMGNISEAAVCEIRHLLEMAKLPVHAPEALTAKGFKKLMAVDKKVQNGKIRFILLHAIGEAYITDDYDDKLLTDCINNSYC
ncbi:MAG: 3-dehydroquinate synthase [Gammaproteobacteria bacterium]|nr:3-dehydroquinate synthase [Gammaproteobacteria bacterium]